MPPTITDLLQAAGADLVTALADDDRDAQPDPGVLDAALLAAQAEVAAALAAAGADPARASDPALADATIALTLDRLLDRRPTAEAPAWRNRAQRARALLAAIAARRHPIAAPATEGTHRDAPGPARRLPASY